MKKRQKKSGEKRIRPTHVSNITVLEEAKKIITGARRKSYGPVERSFKEVATLWSVVFKREVSTFEVALAMIALKLQREANSHHRDNLVDLAGYTALLEQLYDT